MCSSRQDRIVDLPGALPIFSACQTYRCYSSAKCPGSWQPFGACRFVYNQQLSAEKPGDLPAAAKPLAPIEFAIPLQEFDLDFEQV